MRENYCDVGSDTSRLSIDFLHMLYLFIYLHSNIFREICTFYTHRMYILSARARLLDIYLRYLRMY